MIVKNLWDKLQRYGWFSAVEWKGFVIAALVLGFVYASDPSVVHFDLHEGLISWLKGSLLMGAVLFIHHGAQRVAALHYGYRPEHVVWWYGLVGSLLLVLLSGGAVKVYAVSGLLIHMIPAHRIGRFRYGLNLQSFANIAAFGLLANVCAAAVIKTISFIFPGFLPESFVEEWFWSNLLFVCWNLLPIPPLDGSRVLFASRLFYVFLFSAFVGYIFLALAGVFSFIFAFLIGLAGWWAFYWWVER